MGKSTATYFSLQNRLTCCDDALCKLMKLISVFLLPISVLYYTIMYLHTQLQWAPLVHSKTPLNITRNIPSLASPFYQRMALHPEISLHFNKDSQKAYSNLQDWLDGPVVQEQLCSRAAGLGQSSARETAVVI
jgi:hypothetical protein